MIRAGCHTLKPGVVTAVDILKKGISYDYFRVIEVYYGCAYVESVDLSRFCRAATARLVFQRKENGNYIVMPATKSNLSYVQPC